MASAVEKELSKKHYEPPVLTIYGSVQDLTRTMLLKRGGDGGAGGTFVYTGT